MRFKSPLQIPLSSGLLSERRAAQGCSVWREPAVLACPRKCHVHWDSSAIAHKGIAQYSGNCVCDEREIEALAFLPANLLSAFRADVFPMWGLGELHAASLCQPQPRGSLQHQVAATLGQGRGKTLVLWLLFVSWEFCGLLGVVFVLPSPSPDERGSDNTRLHCTLCVGYSHTFRQGTMDWLTFHLVGLTTSTPVILESLYVNHFHLLNFESYTFQLFPLHRKYHHFA